MKLIINKFPPITQRCEIDLSKKVTLFVGKNNAGKTYISQLIWGIYNFDNHKDKYFTFNTDIINTAFITSISSENYSITIDKNILENISKNYSGYLQQKVVEKVFKKVFDTDFDIVFEYSDFYDKEIDSGVIIGDYEVSYSKISQSDEFNIEISGLSVDLIEDENEKFQYDLLNRYLEGVIIQSMLGITPVYMPSTRLFLPSFYKYIYTMEKDLKDTMLDNFTRLNQENKSFFASSYTLPIDKLMDKLVFGIDNPQENQYLDKLTEIIEGKINIDKLEEISMADISYIHKSGEKLPMHLSSSMVNQLVTIYLYFKYWIEEKNNFLLLDEPEMNLHPSKKLDITELLLNFASKNKILLATHSSSIAKFIINYALLFDLKEKKDPDELNEFLIENDLNMNASISLKSNDIGIYYFNGKTISSYKQDDESNFHFGTFSDIEKLQDKQYDYILDEIENES